MGTTTTTPRASRARLAQTPPQHPRRRTAPSGRFSDLPRGPADVVALPSFALAVDDASRHALTLVIAPAGMGKTTQLVDWAARSRPAVRWLTARTGARPTELARALLSGVDDHRPVDTTPRPSRVVARLRRARANPTVLVVDDAHRLDEAGWTLLRTVLEDAPDRVRLVLSTRHEVPLPLVGLELADELTTFRADDLRLDAVASAELVRLHAPDVSDTDLALVRQKARGWPAALVLGARRLTARRNDGTVRPTLERTEQPVLDYLLSDTLESLDPATRHVLVCAAGEHELSEAEATLLSADPDCPARITSLAHDGLLVRDDADESSTCPTWCLHPLLDELLVRRVAIDDSTRDEARAAHLRAARHHVSHGSPSAALHHAARAGMHELTARLVRLHGAELLAGGERDVVTEALDALPDSMLRGRPALRAVAALARRTDGVQPDRPVPTTRRNGTREGEWALVAQPLTEREEDVLAELALGGTYSDIAQTLLVSENTVKTHVASVYRKLGVDRRGAALRRARELDLL